MLQSFRLPFYGINRIYVFDALIIRVIVVQTDVLTPFDLRAQIFKVNMQFSAYNREETFCSKKCSKVTFRLEKMNIICTHAYLSLWNCPKELISAQILQTWSTNTLDIIWNWNFWSESKIILRQVSGIKY